MTAGGHRSLDEAEVARQHVLRLAGREPYAAASSLAELREAGYERSALCQAHGRMMRDSFRCFDAVTQRAIVLVTSALDAAESRAG